MKLRYQMRGLGIGIIITALLMGVTTKKEIPLSDAEIRAQALALGMVESDSLRLTDVAETPSPSGEESGQEWSEGISREAEEGSETDNSEETDPEEMGSGEGGAEGENASAEPDVQPDSGEETESGIADGENITITIEFGMTSYHVSVMLEEAGLVADAVEFDNYLCSNGYSRKISAGIYQIAADATQEEIINIITKNS